MATWPQGVHDIFLTVDQNKYGNKVPFHKYLKKKYPRISEIYKSIHKYIVVNLSTDLHNWGST